MNWIRSHLFSSGDFMPHGHCYLWEPGLVWLQVISNALIGLSYVSISLTLIYLVYRIKDIPFQWMYFAFGLFIITCGFTHFMDVLTVWRPIYWTDGLIRAMTAVASVGTAILLPPLVPKAIALAQGAKAAHDRGIRLENAYEELGTVFEKTKELDELKTQFFANISHELRTPLTLILGPAEKIRDEANLTQSQQQDLDLIVRSARLLLKHVNDLLDIAKLEAGKMAPSYRQVDLAKITRLICGNFEAAAKERDLHFSVDAGEAIQAQIDPDMIERVILNLLSNAFKFVPRGGKIDIRLTQDHGKARLIVRDNGPGVPAKLRDAVFERFRQIERGSNRRYGGTGLGLSIVKQFVELHLGKVSVTETPGGGATFTVELPISAPRGAPVASLEAYAAGEEHAKKSLPGIESLEKLKQVNRKVEDLIPPPSRQKGTVLVVEDNHDMNEFITGILSKDYRVVSAFNGEEGLKEASRVKPDLILSDIMMPGMSGDQMIEEVRKNPQFDSTPILLLTAKADDDLRIRLLREGAQDYVVKPFSVEEVQVRVRNLVTMRKARESLQKELTSQVQDLEELAEEVKSRREQLQQTIGELRVAKDEAVRASRVKSDFLSMVSHEIRTPMTSMKLQLQMLRNSGEFTPKQIELLDRIAKSSDRSMHLMESLLEHAKIQSGQVIPRPARFDIHSLVREVAESLRPEAEGKGLAFELILPTVSAGPLFSDRIYVEMIVRNLITNAIRYTERGKIEVSLTHRDERYLVRIADTGPGIPDEQRRRIFEPFEQVAPLMAKHQPGLGLGLSIAKGAANAIHAQIDLDSKLGRGSVFIASIPDFAIEARNAKVAN